MIGKSASIIAAVWLLGTTAAPAHHSFSPCYDGTRTVTVAGVVTAFRLVNPHALMAIDVTDDAGKVVTWEVEFDGLSQSHQWRLERRHDHRRRKVKRDGQPDAHGVAAPVLRAPRACRRDRAAAAGSR